MSRNSRQDPAEANQVDTAVETEAQPTSVDVTPAQPENDTTVETRTPEADDVTEKPEPAAEEAPEAEAVVDDNPGVLIGGKVYDDGPNGYRLRQS